jgi:hypothetical protein
MMRAMRQGKIVVAGACLLGIVACGGGEKGASSPGTCPDGTVLRGSDCVPADSANEDSAPKHKSSSKSDDSAEAALSSGDSAPSSGGSGKGYDKDAVEAQLKRSARQVKGACGSATDEDGKATGPWGKITATVTLGRNGHVKQVALPPGYDGKPAGLCIVNAFQKVQFPPYPGASDATIDWEVEVVQPKH